MACTSCHVNNNYNLTSTACVTCHQTDYNNATTPINHIQAGFPTTCDVCHNTVVWTQATFNHNNTLFPLTGKHVSVPCASCHVNNNYTTLPTICSGCHITDYNNTTNPNHSAATWPTTCDVCHTTAGWMPASLPAQYHTLFNMNHGNANGVCSTCHTNSSNYAVFQCTGCHGNNNPANFSHPNVGGYVYNSINCYSCHP